MITDNMMHIDPAASAAALDTIPEDVSTRDFRSEVDNQDLEEIKDDSWGENYWNKYSATGREQKVANENSQAFTALSIASTTEAVIDERKTDILGVADSKSHQMQGMPDNSLRGSTSAVIEAPTGRGRRRGSWGREPKPPTPAPGLHDIGKIDDSDGVQPVRLRQPIRFSSINWKMWTLLIFLILAVAAGIIIVVEVLATETKAPSTLPLSSPSPDVSELNDDLYPSPFPSDFLPSFVPSSIPTSSPSTPLETRLYDYLKEQTASLNLSNDFLVPNTPQNDAYQWLLLNDTYSYDGNSTFENRVDQRYALAVFYFATEGRNWLMSNEFLLPDVNECDWAGVYCVCKQPDNSTDIKDFCIIQALTLPNVNLKGRLPLELFSFLSGSLMFIDFQNNSLTGPNPFVAYSGSPLRLYELAYLELSDNQLSGSIPNTIWQTAPNLTHLYLADNRLNSSLPTSFLTVNSSSIPIRRFWLGNNFLTGSLPESMTKWTDLAQLKLDHNQLNSTLPKGLWKLSKLKYLHLSDNQIFGSLLGVEKSQSLVSLQLDNNYLTGSLPTSLPPTLVNAWFNNNSLVGKIPPCFGVNSTDLTSLRLHGNSGLFGDLYCPRDEEYATICGGATGHGSDEYTIQVVINKTEESGFAGLYTADCSNVTCSCCDCYYI